MDRNGVRPAIQTHAGYTLAFAYLATLDICALRRWVGVVLLERDTRERHGYHGHQ